MTLSAAGLHYPQSSQENRGGHVLRRWRVIQTVRVAAVAMRRLFEDVRRRFGNLKQANVKVNLVYCRRDRTYIFAQKVSV